MWEVLGVLISTDVVSFLLPYDFLSVGIFCWLYRLYRKNWLLTILLYIKNLFPDRTVCTGILCRLTVPEYFGSWPYRLYRNTLAPDRTVCTGILWLLNVPSVPEYFGSWPYRLYRNTLAPDRTVCTRILWLLNVPSVPEYFGSTPTACTGVLCFLMVSCVLENFIS